MFGPCKICQEKELRISELKEQILYFKNLLNPTPQMKHYELQENLVLNGGGEEIVDEETQRQEYAENERIKQEADFIFSGLDSEINVNNDPDIETEQVG